MRLCIGLEFKSTRYRRAIQMFPKNLSSLNALYYLQSVQQNFILNNGFGGYKMTLTGLYL